MADTTQKRIIFIDIMRAFAVFMMVQGHTVDSFLSEDLKTSGSVLFEVWNYLRGFTAPIFMFSAGVAFAYLFHSRKEKFKDNPRVKKGIKRFATLIVLAYFLRFPTYRIFNLSEVTPETWNAFFVVDALHLIAFGLLFIIFFFYLSEKLRIKESYLLIAGSVLFVVLQILFEPINWKGFMHPMLAAYFYSGSGSFFPLFPWIAYMLCGALLGGKIAANPDIVRSPSFGAKMIIWAAIIFTAGKGLEQIKFALNWGEPLWVNATYWFTLRIGYVLALNGIMSLISHKVNDVPKIVKLFGRYSLLIYVVHVVVLYGNAWVPSLNFFNSHRFGLIPTLFFIVVVLLLMALLVFCIDYLKRINEKPKPAADLGKLNVELNEK